MAVHFSKSARRMFCSKVEFELFKKNVEDGSKKLDSLGEQMFQIKASLEVLKAKQEEAFEILKTKQGEVCKKVDSVEETLTKLSNQVSNIDGGLNMFFKLAGGAVALAGLYVGYQRITDNTKVKSKLKAIEDEIQAFNEDYRRFKEAMSQKRNDEPVGAPAIAHVRGN